MAALSSKLRSVAFDVGRGRIGVAHWCPGCDGSHAVSTEGDVAKGPTWSWDGNIAEPTLSPSVRIVLYGGPKGTDVKSVCHYFLRGGRIECCADSTHALAGRTVALPDWPGESEEAAFYLAAPHDLVDIRGRG